MADILELAPTAPLRHAEIVQGMAACVIWNYEPTDMNGNPLADALTVPPERVDGVISGGSLDQQGNGFLHLTPKSVANSNPSPPRIFRLVSRTPSYLRESQTWATSRVVVYPDAG